MTLNTMADSVEQDSSSCDNSGHGQGHEQELPVAERLKEQFGDYSDPNIYDWSRCEGE